MHPSNSLVWNNVRDIPLSAVFKATSYNRATVIYYNVLCARKTPLCRRNWTSRGSKSRDALHFFATGWIWHGNGPDWFAKYSVRLFHFRFVSSPWICVMLRYAFERPRLWHVSPTKYSESHSVNALFYRFQLKIITAMRSRHVNVELTSISK